MLCATPVAAETTRSFTVDATIVQGCAVSGTAGVWGRIDFGTVSGLTTGNVDANLVSSGNGGLRIECTPGTRVTMEANNGLHEVSGQRRMTQAGVATAVPYSLFAAGSATPWTTQAIPLSFPVGSTVTTVPIRGRALLPGALPAGRYGDTVRITLTW